MEFCGRFFQSPVVLAPMAGVTDWAFRSVCADLGADITVTEMVSSRALVYKDKKSAALLKKNVNSLCGAQIFGSDPQIMAQGAVLALEISGCDFIDINMGCPMPKIVGNGDGSALMRDPELAGRIVEAVRGAVAVPVTVKMRLGWDKGSLNAPEFARILEQAGCSAVAVHGRTRSMLYSGRADWDAIARVKASVTIPVIANGDIFSGEDAAQCRRRTGADGFMVGRGTFGNPWLCGQVRAALSGIPEPALPPLTRRMEVALGQFHLALVDKGEHIACLEARKQLAWYLKGVAYANYYKEQISQIKTAADVERIVRGVQKDLC